MSSGAMHTCPLCGGEPRLCTDEDDGIESDREYYFVRCDECYVCTPYSENEDDAVDEWNKLPRVKEQRDWLAGVLAGECAVDDADAEHPCDASGRCHIGGKLKTDCVNAAKEQWLKAAEEAVKNNGESLL